MSSCLTSLLKTCNFFVYYPVNNISLHGISWLIQQQFVSLYNHIECVTCLLKTCVHRHSTHNRTTAGCMVSDTVQ